MTKEAERVWNEGGNLLSIEATVTKSIYIQFGRKYWEVYYDPGTNQIDRINKATEKEEEK